MVDPERRAPESDWDLIRPRNERNLEALERRIEALEHAPREEPWWRNPKTVTFIAGLLAAFIPLTTAVDGYFKGKSSLALAAEQQRHAMRMDYMKTALDPQAPEIQRQSRLRLLVAILDADDPARGWAQSELGAVNDNVNQLKATLKQTQTELVAAQADETQAKKQLNELESKLREGPTPARTPPPEHQVLQREVEKARLTLQTVTQRKDRLSTRAASAAEKLTGQAKSPLYRTAE